MTRSRVPNPAIIGLLLALAPLVSARPAMSSRQPTTLFAFHSNFWVNLHHFLYITSRARAGLDAGRANVTSSLADTVGFGALPNDLRQGWNDALTYYAKSVSTKDVLFDQALVTVNDRLAELDGATRLGTIAGLDTGIARALDRAAPAYRALWWPRHDAANQRWTQRVQPILARFGDSTARAESRAFGRLWSPTPVRVDVAAYTNWAGAYTTERPGHINIVSRDPNMQDTVAFEMLFHEVLHTMDDSVLTVIGAAFAAAGKTAYRDPTHPFIFYTAGALTQRLFPRYMPFAEAGGIWTRSPDFARMLPLLRQYWQPYLDGRSSLEDAARGIAQMW